MTLIHWLRSAVAPHTTRKPSPARRLSVERLEDRADKALDVEPGVPRGSVAGHVGRYVFLSQASSADARVLDP